jgi:hypothetical protein
MFSRCWRAQETSSAQHQATFMHRVRIICVLCALTRYALTTMIVSRVLLYCTYLFQENKSYGSKKLFAFILWCTGSFVSGTIGVGSLQHLVHRCLISKSPLTVLFNNFPPLLKEQCSKISTMHKYIAFSCRKILKRQKMGCTTSSKSALSLTRRVEFPGRGARDKA